MESEEVFAEFRRLNGEKIAKEVSEALATDESKSIIAPLGSGKTHRIAQLVFTAKGMVLYIAPSHSSTKEFVGFAKDNLKNNPGKKLVYLEGHERTCTSPYRCYKQKIKDEEIAEVLKLKYIDADEILKILPNACPYQLMKRIVESGSEDLIVAAPYAFIHELNIEDFKTFFIDEADFFTSQIIHNDLTLVLKIAADVSGGLPTTHATKETGFSCILQQKNDNRKLKLSDRDPHFVQNNSVENLIKLLREGQEEYCKISGSPPNGAIEAIALATDFLKTDRTKYLSDLIDNHAKELQKGKNLIVNWLTEKEQTIKTNHKILLPVSIPVEAKVDLNCFQDKTPPFAVKYYAIFADLIEKCNGDAYLSAFDADNHTHYSEVALVGFQKEKLDALRKVFSQSVCILISATSNGLENILFENIKIVTICEGKLPYTAKYLHVPYTTKGKLNRKIRDLPALVLAKLKLSELSDESLTVVYENSKSDAYTSKKKISKRLISGVSLMSTEGTFLFEEQEALNPVKPPHRTLVAYMRDRSYRGVNAGCVDLLFINGSGIPSLNAEFLIYGILKNKELVTVEFDEFVARQRRADITQVANRSHRDGSKNRIVIVQTDLYVDDFPKYVAERMVSVNSLIPKTIKKTRSARINAIIEYTRKALVQNIPRTQKEELFKKNIIEPKEHLDAIGRILTGMNGRRTTKTELISLLKVRKDKAQIVIDLAASNSIISADLSEDGIGVVYERGDFFDGALALYQRNMNSPQNIGDKNA